MKMTENLPPTRSQAHRISTAVTYSKL